MPQPAMIPFEEVRWSARISAGDEQAFRQLFELYYEPLCRYATTLVGDVDAGQDVVQAVFVWIWEHRAAWKLHGSIRGYLYRAVHSRVVSGWRAARVREAYASRVQADEGVAGGVAAIGPGEWPDQAAQYADLQAAYWRALAKLPPRGRQAIELHQQHGLTCREIADVMGISSRTVEVHIGRGLVALRKALATYLGVVLLVLVR